MENIIGIYKLTNPKGYVYIGKSFNVVSRIKSYRTPRCFGQILLLQSLIEYGFGNHKVEIIELCGKDVINEREAFYIKKYKNKSLNIIHVSKNKNTSDAFKQVSDTFLTKNRSRLSEKKCQIKEYKQ